MDWKKMQDLSVRVEKDALQVLSDLMQRGSGVKEVYFQFAQKFGTKNKKNFIHVSNFNQLSLS